MRSATLLLLVLVPFIATAGQVSNSSRLTPRDIAKQALPSVVLIIMENSSDQTGQAGSGFFVSQDTIATNLHVIKNCDKGVVKIVGQDPLYDILGVVGVDEKNDLALLRIAHAKGKTLTLNSDDSTAIGDEVFAVGNPRGLEGTFSEGIVSSIRNSAKRSLIQITAPISEGSSGGAVMNDRGEVVGVAVGAIESGQSLNFAIPVSFLRSLVANQKPIVALKHANNSLPAVQKVGLIPAPSASSGTSRILFKPADLATDNLFGNIRTTREFLYVPEKKFDEWIWGEPVALSTTSYGRDGNRENDEVSIYSEKGKGVSADITFWLFFNATDNFPATVRQSYSYDSSKNQVTEATYRQCSNCSAPELLNKFIIKFVADGEVRFDNDGAMFQKTVRRKTKDGKATKSVYDGDGTLEYEDVIYSDQNGQVTESWRPSKIDKRSMELSSRTVTKETADQLRETLICITEKDPVCGRIEISDKRTKLRTRVEFGTTVWKYDYEFDSHGNWIKQTQSQQVQKFGKTYFEPKQIVLREITYY